MSLHLLGRRPGALARCDPCLLLHLLNEGTRLATGAVLTLLTHHGRGVRCDSFVRSLTH